MFISKERVSGDTLGKFICGVPNAGEDSTQNWASCRADQSAGISADVLYRDCTETNLFR